MNVVRSIRWMNIKYKIKDKIVSVLMVLIIILLLYTFTFIFGLSWNTIMPKFGIEKIGYFNSDALCILAIIISVKIIMDITSSCFVYILKKIINKK